MANILSIKKSSVASKVPLPADLSYGELAINYTDGKLYFKNSSNVIKNFITMDEVNAADYVTRTTDQTITGNKTFSNLIIGSVNGNAATATTLQTARTINGVSFNGSTNILVPSIYDGNYRRISQPGGGEYVTTAATVTGAIAIQLPTAGYTNEPMISFEVCVYEYASNKSFTIFVHGYQYSAGNWINTSAYSVSDGVTDRRFNVRFAKDTTAGRFIVYIGELASTWSYPQVFVKNVSVGYAPSVNFVSGWGIAFESTAFATVASTIYTRSNYSSSSNVVNSLVLRDSSGNFSAGNITATKLISQTFDTTGVVSFLNAGAAQGIKVGSLVVSNSYSNNAPTNGIYVTGQIQSAVATGTAPLVIASTTKVANLNADLLDDMNTSSTNTASTIVARDSSGNFLANSIGLNTSLSSFSSPGWLQLSAGVVSNNNAMYVGANLYFDGAWKYTSTGAASLCQMTNGNHYWYSAPSGTANTSIPWTNSMTLDASGNLGLGTASPLYRVSVAPGDKIGYSEGTTYGYFEPYSATGNMNFMVNWTGGSTESITFGTAGVERVRIDTDGNLSIGAVGGSYRLYVEKALSGGWTPNTSTPIANLHNSVQEANSTSMVLYSSFFSDGTFTGVKAGSVASGSYSADFVVANRNVGVFQENLRVTAAGNLGVNTASPQAKLHVAGDIQVRNPGAAFTKIRADAQIIAFVNATDDGYVPGVIVGQTLAFGTGYGNTALSLDANGNLGLGVTPSAWSAPFKVMQLGVGASVSGQTDNYTQAQISTNAYYNSGWKYIAGTSAAQYVQAAGTHSWSIAPVGTAGNPISFTQAMTLDTSGNLNVTGNVSSAGTLYGSTFVQSAIAGNTTTATTQFVFATFSTGGFQALEILLSAKQGSNVHVTKLLVTHDTVTAIATEYGTLRTSTSLFNADVDISGGNVRVLITPTSATSTTFKASYNYLT